MAAYCTRLVADAAIQRRMRLFEDCKRHAHTGSRNRQFRSAVAVVAQWARDVHGDGHIGAPAGELARARIESWARVDAWLGVLIASQKRNPATGSAQPPQLEHGSARTMASWPVSPPSKATRGA